MLSRMAIRLLPVLFLGGCEPPSTPPFEYVLVDQPAGFFSVHGTSASDVWVVGGADALGTGSPVLLHYDGSGWLRRDLSGLELLGTDLWWVHALTPSDIFVAGEGGTILRYGGTAFTRMATPATGTVFGLWAASAGEAWAVGGLDGSGFVWHFDGSVWQDVPLPATHPGASVFKVWGTAEDDVWFCGLMGTLMHWDGVALSMVSSPTSLPLFTLHAVEGEVAVVGGAGRGVLLRGTDGVFTDVTPVPEMGGAPGPQMNGVWLTGRGEGYAVGIYGGIMRMSGGAWADEASVYDDLHGVWVDPSGGVWAVGGIIQSVPSRSGVVLHRGTPISDVVAIE